MSEAALERASHVALYQQIAEALEAEIVSGRLAPLARLESEAALTRRYGVSRVTIRQALDILAKRELIVRKQGKGTFVNPPPLSHELAGLRGIYEAVRSLGLPLDTRLLSFGPEDAPERILDLLGPAPLFRLSRLYLLDGQPLGVIHCWLPAAARALTEAEARGMPIYGLLQRLDLAVERADLGIGSRPADRPLAELLQLPPAAPLLVLDRVSHGADNRPLEVTEFLVRADRYRFSLTVRGEMPLAERIRSSEAEGFPA